MIGAWIMLIMVDGAHGKAVQTVPMHSYEACVDAAKTLDNNRVIGAGKWSSPYTFFCVNPATGETVLVAS